MRGPSATTVAALRMAVAVTLVATTAVVLGGSVAWLTERNVPGRTFGSWGDTIWWAVTTLTTVGYGDHVPVTTIGRVIAGVVMVVGVGVIGGVAAVVALIMAQAVASAEERALEAEADSIERRINARLDDLDVRLARIEENLRFVTAAHGRAEDARR
jgi:voltage-gated potassium channel